MELAGVNDERNAILEAILKRLDRLERRLRVLEREKKNATTYPTSKGKRT
jgi:hypothetical protein